MNRLPAPIPCFISAAVEGDVDEAALRRVSETLGATIHAVYGKKGKSHLRQKVESYNRAANFSPWIFLIDLDDEAQCAAELVRAWLPRPAPQMCFRVAVREIESWLLADGEMLARFLRVPRSRIPNTPELLNSPKRTIVEIAQHSSSRAIREEITPRLNSGRIVGPAYSSRIIQFIQDTWRPLVAQENSDSLRRCISRVSDFIRAPNGPRRRATRPRV